MLWEVFDTANTINATKTTSFIPNNQENKKQKTQTHQIQ